MRTFTLLAFAVLVTGIGTFAHGQTSKLEPGDPVAAIDGTPIYLAEVNLVLTERISPRDLPRVGPEVIRATAELIVKRALAMNALRKQGGAALQSSIQKRVDAYTAEASRKGTSISELAQARSSTVEAMVADIAWKSAWSQYLKSRMTDANMRRFFEANRTRYGGTRWDVSQIFIDLDPTDVASIRATNESLKERIAEIRASDSPEQAFAETATMSSQGPTANEGGHVGWVETDGDLPSAVMASVRSLKPGQVGNPVTSPAGVHVVFVHEIDQGNRGYDDLTDLSQLRRDAADALFDNLVKSESDSTVNWFIPGS